MKKFFDFIKSLFIDLTDYICVFIFILTILLTLLIMVLMSPVILVAYIIYCIVTRWNEYKKKDDSIIIHTTVENEKVEDVQNSTSGEEK